MKEKDYRLAAIMYTDIVGFSRMMGEHEAETLKLLEIHNNLIEQIVQKYQGTVIKTIGDAYMVDFRNTIKALQSAIEIQDKLYEYNTAHDSSRLLIRIGLHLGDIYFYENDALGEGINIAARLQSFANPGCICFSQDVFNQVLNKIDFHADNLGKVSLKNITKEIIAYEIATKNIEFDHDKSVRNRKISVLEEPAKDNAAPVKPAAVKAVSPENKENSAERPDSWFAAGQTGAGYDTGKKKTASSYGFENGQKSSEKSSASNTSSEESGYKKNEKNIPPEGAQWDFNIDGRRLGIELNRAVQGLVSLAERKLNTFIDAAGQGGNGNCGNTAQTRSPGRSETHASAAYNAADMEPGRQQSSDMETRWQQWLSEKNGTAASFMQERERNSESYQSAGQYGRARREKDSGGTSNQYVYNRKKGQGPWSFEQVRLNAAEKYKKAAGGLFAHFVTFAMVNGGLWFLNMVSGSYFPWAAIVTCAWGIGFVSTIVSVSGLGRTSRELEKITELDEASLQAYKKVDQSRKSMARHTASAFTVSLLLIVINVITGDIAAREIFPWALIPSGILIGSWLIHFSGYGTSINSLKKKLCTLAGVARWSDLFKNGRKPAPENVTPGQTDNEYAALIAEAEGLRDTIVRQIKKSREGGPLKKSNIQALNCYVVQIRSLAGNVSELDALIASVPVGSLKRDKIVLTVKMKNAENTGLKNEYEKTIGEIEKQEIACVKLAEQRDTLNLKLKSSVGTLKRMQLDMARMAVTSEVSGGSAVFDQIKRDSDELTQYLEDLRAGYREVEME